MRKTEKTPNVLFQKKLLSDRIADTLRASILKGIWKNYLPTERSLCSKVEATRPMVRKALHVLAEEGLIKVTPGHPAQILASALEKRVPIKRKHVVMLIQRSVELFGNSQTIFVDEIRSRLSAAGYSFEVVVDRRLPQKRVAHFLKELTLRHEADHWILSSVPLAVQEWFQKEGFAAVIDGSSFPQITLPSADFDHRAIGRHAAGVLLGLGHRRIGIFFRSWETAGDRAMEAGFREAFRSHPDASPEIILCSDEVSTIRARLKSLLARKDRPTALVVSNAMDFIVIMTSLLEWGLRIPNDMSLIVQHPDTFLDRLTPLPARYAIDTVKLAQAVCRLVENPGYGGGRIRRIPPFLPGGSLAVPPVLPQL